MTRYRKILFIVFFMLALSLEVFKEQKILLLEQKLSCPACSGQSLFESNHPIAEEICSIINEQRQQGASEQAILEALQASYGDKIFSIELGRVQATIYIILFFGALYVLRQRQKI